MFRKEDFDMKNNYFASNLKLLRTRRGLEQKDISDFLGLKSPTSVTNWEKGSNLARAGHLSDLATFFGVSLHDLVQEDLSKPKLTKQNNNLDISTIYTQLTHPRQERVYDFAVEQLNEQNGIQEDKMVYLVRGRQSAAGSMIYVDDVDAEMGVLPSSIVPNGANELVQITGDSMEPIIKKGSEVYLRYQPTVEDGEIAIVRVEDDGVTCKYLFRDGKNIVLKSENSKYDDIVVDANKVSVIGKVLI
jgi:bifunctional S24 family peptidase/transcriptional regulator